MTTKQVIVSKSDTTKFHGDMLVFFAAVGKNGKLECDKKIRSALDHLYRLGDFKAKEGETQLFYPISSDKEQKFAAKRILVIGLGEKNKTRSDAEAAEIMRSAGGTIATTCSRYDVKDVMLAPAVNIGMKPPIAAECVCEGLVLGDYRFEKYKKPKDDKRKGEIKKIIFSAGWHSSDLTLLRNSARRGAVNAKFTNEARDMANEPGNHWTALHFADYARKIADELSLKCRIMEKAELKKKGFGGIIAVNQGSSQPPKLIVLEHEPEKYKKTILLVGKGLTFDSGGVSLKPAAGMQDMKYDMCGGAAVLGAIQAIASENLPVRVVAIVPATDNMAGGGALKPGDVISHYNGVTSEIVNTDAEGRLILADALAFGIKKYSPDCVVDVATLTGAAIIGLGHHRTGLLSNDDKVVEKLVAAGDRCGEPLWQLPLGPEYSKQIESQVADIKNAGGRPAGTITAAAYLQNFVGETPWAHLDIAGTAWDFTEKTYIPKGPSGIMVRTLVQLVRDWK